MPAGPFSKHTAMAAAIAALFPSVSDAAGVARVEFAAGEVTAVGLDGKSRPLARGSEIAVGESVVTRIGRAQLRFADGAYMSLQPQTEFKVEQFRFAGKEDGTENIVMNLIKGGMRTITGVIGRSNRQNYTLRTETATIGIRGTEYTVRYTNSIEVFCVFGWIFVFNDGGTLNLTSGQGASVANFQTAPQRSEQPPFLPPRGGGGQQQQQEQASNDPVNPTQEANPPVTEEKAREQIPPPVAPPITPPPPITPITGTLAANWSAGCFTCNNSQVWGANTFDFTTPHNAQATFDALGKATAFANAIEGPFNIGTASAIADGNDGIIAWGRWLNGVSAGSNTRLGGKTLTAADPLYYVAGLPVTNMPATGTATYTVIGNTPISFNGGITSATLNTGPSQTAIMVNFASASASMLFSMNVNGQTFSTSALPLTRSNTDRFGGGPSATGQLFSGNGTLSGGAGGSLNVHGFLAGDGASRAGATFSAFINSPISGSTKGAIAFTKN